MMEDKNQFEIFRAAASEKKINPSEGAWDQLSERLDAHRQQEPVATAKMRKLGWQKWLGIAAGFLVLIAVFTTTLKMIDDDNPAFGQLASSDNSLMIEDLVINKDHSNNFYALAVKCNQYYNTSPSRLAEGKFDQRIQVTEGKNRRQNNSNIQDIASASPIDINTNITADTELAITSTSIENLSNITSSEIQIASADMNGAGDARGNSEEFSLDENTYSDVTSSVIASSPAMEISEGMESEANIALATKDQVMADVAADEYYAEEKVKTTSIEKSSARAKRSSIAKKEAKPSVLNVLLGEWKTEIEDEIVLIQEWKKISTNTFNGTFYSIHGGEKKELIKVTITETGDLLSILDKNGQVVSSNLVKGKYQNIEEFLGIKFSGDHLLQIEKNGIFKNSKKGRKFTKVN